MFWILQVEIAGKKHSESGADKSAASKSFRSGRSKAIEQIDKQVSLSYNMRCLFLFFDNFYIHARCVVYMYIKWIPLPTISNQQLHLKGKASLSESSLLSLYDTKIYFKKLYIGCQYYFEVSTLIAFPSQECNQHTLLAYIW